MNRYDPQNVYEVLDLLRWRPGIFGVRNMETLDAFLCGLGHAHLPQGSPPHSHFRAWVNAAEVDNEGGFPLRMFAERFDREYTLELYFELLDKYLACECVTLGSAFGPFDPTFTIADSLDEDGLPQGRPPEKPRELRIVHFAPSRAHALLKLFATHEEFHQPFARSRDEALAIAEAYWTVPPARWRFD